MIIYGVGYIPKILNQLNDNILFCQIFEHQVDAMGCTWSPIQITILSLATYLPSHIGTHRQLQFVLYFPDQRFLSPFNISKTYLLSLILFGASTKSRKIVLPFDYIMKFIILNLVDPVTHNCAAIYLLFLLLDVDINFHIFVFHVLVLNFI